ncbi:hypothetical protein [uncultured Campylobacter sp.]|uniref:DUF6115 domain-containing protein n=1 Tax=uncultured Campylobacter sp. TaxID=218934 RepID=UPI0025F831EF|nr:hypothetical protein [uncultured Campylobacter sp.]
MNSDLMIFAIFGLILTILFVLVFVKDLEVSRKFSRYEKAIEGLIQELHAVKKQVANLDLSEPGEFDAAQLESNLEQRLNEKINQKITPIINTLQSIESSIDSFQSQQQDRLFTLEERTKSISKITAPNGEDDEKRIVQMYSEGKSVESIAKELCVGVGKVELTLKLRELI